MFYMAGSAIPVEVPKRFLSIGIVPQNIYGMTENGSHQYTLPNDSVDTMVRTCGRPCSAYEVNIWNSENNDVEAAQDEIGELSGRGAGLENGRASGRDRVGPG